VRLKLILDEIASRNLADATLSELAQIACTTGRLGGLAIDDEQPEEVTIRIVRDPSPNFGHLVRHDVQPDLPEAPREHPLLPPPTDGPSRRW